MVSTVADRTKVGAPQSRPAACESSVGPVDSSLGFVVHELQHRIRNLLTVVQCFVKQTDAATTADYRLALSERLSALSDAYSLIERAGENRISLTEILERTLTPHAAVTRDRIYAAGPEIDLEPRLALSLHMILDELASNGTKHGALSSPTGSVELRWTLLADCDGRKLAIQWNERGGPEASEPKRSGFGLRLITSALAGSQVRLEFNRTGLGSVGIQDSHPGSVVIQAMDGPIRFD
ncbi:sensor histidine kinase [Bradyrhizobium cenepequi]|uniref:sensor histidine kinase n=1 Tax=Bradyrhizobium cenepequi TaxID=2821403 RepID=UPI001CE24F3B|nr:sensor histidine kinase [Bradyrhizobium cenepequi]MCA6113191.1 sensor histidine kinase [Bradyrhizobium cenepequi]